LITLEHIPLILYGSSNPSFEVLKHGNHSTPKFENSNFSFVFNVLFFVVMFIGFFFLFFEFFIFLIYFVFFCFLLLFSLLITIFFTL